MGDKKELLRVKVVNSHVENFIAKIGRFAWVHLLNYKKEVRLNNRLFR